MSRKRIATVGSVLIDYMRREQGIVEDLGGRKLFQQDEFDAFLVTHSGTEGKIGGSAFNTIRTMAHLVQEGLVELDLCHFTLLGKDQREAYLKIVHELDITPYATYVEEKTGQVLCLVTRGEQGVERTMRVVAGASANSILLDVKEMEGSSLIHLDGYTLFMDGVIHQHFPAPLSLDLGSFEVIEAKQELFFSLLKERKVAYLFANEKEVEKILELQGYSKRQQTAEEGCAYLRQFCEGVVVTQGSKGLFYSVGEDPGVYHVNAFPVASTAVIDPTGAGDQCNGTFLAFLLAGYPAEICAKMACRVSAEGIQCLGADLTDPKRWKAIKEYFMQEF